MKKCESKIKNQTKKARFFFFVCAAISVFFFLLLSCSSRTENKNFSTWLDSVDTYINTNQNEDALKLLKKNQKYAYSSSARIGVYRRFIILGDEKSAEKVLTDGLKKLPENPELSAVYGHFLIRHDRLPEALEIAKVLRGGKYGAIYSEAYLKSISQQFSSEEDIFDSELLSSEMSEIYKDAYAGSKDGKWLINAALPLLKDGKFAQASKMQPDSLYSDFEYLFWAQVQYDCGKFDLCIKNIEDAKENESFASADLFSLESDAWIMLGDEDLAEKARNEIIKLYAAGNLPMFPALVYVNSSIWSRKNEDYVRCYDLLMNAIMNEPDFVPALLTYSRFAYEASLPVDLSPLEQSVRKTELRSLSMQKVDSRPKFLLSDAEFRLQSAEQNYQKSDPEMSAIFAAERLSLFLKTNEDLPLNQRIAEIWKTLEKNEISVNLYPPILVNLAVSKLLSFGLFDSAEELFFSYIDARYRLLDSPKFEEKSEYDIFGGKRKQEKTVIPDYVKRAALGNRAADYSGNLDLWECEFAAYFALKNGNVDAAERIYEYLLFESDYAKQNLLSLVSSRINLAMIYSSSERLAEAVSMYGRAAGLCRNSTVKSMILYRTALAQSDMNNINDALLSLDYSISLDPMNAEARLLQKQLKLKLGE